MTILVLFVTTESVNLDLAMRQNILCHLFASAWLCAVWLCLKMGSENMVLVRLLQIGAKNLTVTPEEPILYWSSVIFSSFVLYWILVLYLSFVLNLVYQDT